MDDHCSSTYSGFASPVNLILLCLQTEVSVAQLSGPLPLADYGSAPYVRSTPLPFSFPRHV